MSDSCKGSKLDSIGTIHYRYMLSGEDSLFFVPDSNHCLEYSENSYAVFVSVSPPANEDGMANNSSPDSTDGARTPDNEDGVRCALAVPLSNNKDRGIFLKKSVPIKIPKCCDKMRDVLQVALQAAETGAAVTVTVEMNDNSLKLVGITFPAR